MSQLHPTRACIEARRPREEPARAPLVAYPVQAAEPFVLRVQILVRRASRPELESPHRPQPLAAAHAPSTQLAAAGARFGQLTQPRASEAPVQTGQRAAAAYAAQAHAPDFRDACGRLVHVRA